MAPFDRRAKPDHLGQYWDALVRGAAEAELARLAEPLDPDVVAMVARMRALRQAQRPDAAFIHHLERDLMQAFASAHPGTVPLRAPLPNSPNGLAPSRVLDWSAVRRPSSWRWALAQAATVLLLIGSLLSTVWLLRPNDEPAVIVPAVGTPTPDATPTEDWTTYRGTPGRTGVSASPGPAGSPLQLWRAVTGDRVNSEPAIVDGVMYVGSEDHHLYALDAATGEERWRFDAGTAVSSTPAVVAGVLYTGIATGDLIAIDAATGDERWRFPGARDQASPAVADGVVYTGGEDGNLYALDAATGEVQWSLALGGVPSRSPAVGEGLVVIGADDGFVHAVDLATGQERWRFQIEDDGTIATPVIANGVVYEAAFDGAAPRLYALDEATGEELWQFATEGNESVWVPVVTADTLYAGSNDGNVYAIDAATGAERWRFTTGDIVPSSATLAGPVLFAASYDRNLYALDAASGEELWRFPLDHEVDKGPSIADGVAYVGTKAGSVYAIAGTESATEAASSSTTASASATQSAAAPDAASPPLELVWQTTGGAEPLFGAGSVAIDPQGNLYVFDGPDRYQIFSPDGEFLEMWDGTSGGGERFDFHSEIVDGPEGNIAFDAAGYIFVVEAGARRVQVFDAERRFVTAWGGSGTGDGQFTTPIGIAVDAAGNVYVADLDNTRVQQFSPDGALLAVWDAGTTPTGGDNYPYALAVDDEGNLYVAGAASDYETDSNLQKFRLPTP